MRQDGFEFKPNFKLIIVGNHVPQLRNVDDAIRRRFNIIPFENKPKTPDKKLGFKLKKEYPAILAWMIRGCLEWQMTGLAKPAIVAEKTELYLDEQDMFSNWVEEACTVGGEYGGKLEDLFESWKNYCLQGNVRPGRRAAFTENLRRAGFTYVRTATDRIWRGITLKGDEELIDF
jgi:putative DNA primase/helicase